MISQPLNLRITDSVAPPMSRSASTVFYTKDEASKTVWYDVWIYLEGDPKDLFYVDYVVYHLHKSFPNPVVKVERTPSNPYCALAIKVWGTFIVKAEIVSKSGDKMALEHLLGFDNELKRDNINFKLRQ